MQGVGRVRSATGAGGGNARISTGVRGATRTRKTQTLFSTVSLYQDPPQDELSLQEFEDFALDRIQVLKAIDSARAAGKNTAEVEAVIKKSLRAAFPDASRENAEATAGTLAGSRFSVWERDTISHYICRLAYCRRDDLRKWLLANEVTLFEARLRAHGVTEDLLTSQNLSFSVLDDDDLTRHERSLQAMLRVYGPTRDQNNAVFYKVPFEKALRLVKRRKAFMSAGYAFVHEADLIELVVAEFRSRLSLALVTAAKCVPYVNEDERLLPILTNVSTQYLGQDYSKNNATGEVSLDQIDALSERSFPLCMKNLHDNLRLNHHLKHGGRMQYGLFLKGIGLNVEDALAFWRGEFVQMMGEDKFAKSYAYNIRHNYGLEGKKKSYSPYSCMKIIMSSAPGHGDHHGCPFRHFSFENLHGRLQNAGLPHEGVTEVMELVRGNHFQVACSRYYFWTHGAATLEPAINHPNEYFVLSERHYNGDAGMEGAEGSGTGGATSAAAAAAGPGNGLTAEDAAALEAMATAGFDDMWNGPTTAGGGATASPAVTPESSPAKKAADAPMPDA